MQINWLVSIWCQLWRSAWVINNECFSARKKFDDLLNLEDNFDFDLSVKNGQVGASKNTDKYNKYTNQIKVIFWKKFKKLVVVRNFKHVSTLMIINYYISIQY